MSSRFDKFYTDDVYAEINPTFHAEESPWKAKVIYELILRHHLNPKTVCEVGCGAGEILNELYGLMNDDVHFTGMDISPKAIELSKKKENNRLHYYQKDIFSDSSRYDLLLCIDVFEHIPDFLSFLTKLKLKATYKIFHIPLDINVLCILLNRIIKYRKDFGHLHHFTKDTALQTLIDLNYEILDWVFSLGKIDIKSQSIFESIIKIPRKIIFRINKNLGATLLGDSLLVLAK